MTPNETVERYAKLILQDVPAYGPVSLGKNRWGDTPTFESVERIPHPLRAALEPLVTDMCGRCGGNGYYIIGHGSWAKTYGCWKCGGGGEEPHFGPITKGTGIIPRDIEAWLAQVPEPVRTAASVAYARAIAEACRWELVAVEVGKHWYVRVGTETQTIVVPDQPYDSEDGAAWAALDQARTSLGGE